METQEKVVRPKRPLFREIATLIGAIENCEKSNNLHWLENHTETIESMNRVYLPHGSGFDSGCKISLDRSTSEKIVIDTEYHHMNDVGMYDGWTSHVVTVRASLQFGYTLKITGENKNDIKDYMHDVFGQCLSEMID